MPRAREARFAAIFNQSPLAAGISRLRDGVFLEVNEAFVQLYGYPREEIIGHTSAELQLWYSGDRAQMIAELRAKKKVFVEMQGRRKNGEIRDLLASVQLTEMDGEPCLVGSLVDLTERKRTEATLRLHSVTVATMAEGVCLVRVRDEIIVYANPRFEQMFGYEPGEMNGLPVSKVNHEANAQAAATARQIIAQLEQSGEAVYEVQNVRKDGSPFWSRAHTCTLDHPDHGQVWIAVHEDITERKQAESRLQKSESRFRALVAAGADMLFWVSPDWSDLLQLSSRQFLAETTSPDPNWLAKYIHPDDQPGMRAAIRQAIRAKKTFELEHRVMRSDGRLGWLLSRAVPILDDAGNILEWFGAGTDVTLRKEAQAALQTSESALRQAQRMAGLGNWEWNPQTGRHVWSEEIYRILGRDPSLPPPVYPGSSQYFTPESWARLSAAVDKAFTEGVAYECDTEAVRPDGTRRWVTARGEAVRDASGIITGLRGTLHDITERKRLEGERAEALARLTVIQAEERQRISRELHDQTTQSLVALAVGLKNLERDLAAGRPYGKPVQWLRRTVDDLQQQVRQIAWDLRAGEPSRGRLPAALHDYLEEWSERAHVAVDYECRGFGDQQLPATVESTLYRVAQEALSNVQRHARAARVSVLLERDEAMARLTVEDDGCGFAVDAVEKSGGSTPRLGLLGMKERVTLAGGTLLIESSPGSGATILARIPIPIASKSS